MKTALFLVVVITALGYAEVVVEGTQKTKAANTEAANKSTFIDTPPAVGRGVPVDIQQAVAGNMDLKLVTMKDGTPRGKCYCSCNLNNQLEFLEIGSDHLLLNYDFEPETFL